ncbi:MAG: hypothetical protein HC906_09040 [Bacteroidales bacterium]|nr:hypothetical protein [Bacteroidales bacterium]
MLLVSINIHGNIPTNQNYRVYYEKVNHAELLVVEHKFKSALDIYTATFKEFNNHDPKDVYNASLCAIKSGDFEKAKIWIKDLITLGYCLDSLKNKGTFMGLPPAHWEDIQAKNDSLFQVFKSKFDWELKTILDTMDAQEQFCLKYKNASGYDSLVLSMPKY